MYDRNNPEHDIPLSQDVLVPNLVFEPDASKEGVVFPSAVACHVDELTTEFAGRVVPTKVCTAFNAMKQKAGDLNRLEIRMSPYQATLLRAALEKYRGHALSLVRLYQKICDARNLKPDVDDRMSLVNLAKQLKQ